MANGLRKLIRNASRASKTTLLTRRLQRHNRFGRRLRVEELEERIAPAITVAPDGFITWDVAANDNAHDASDGYLGLGFTSTIDNIQVTDIADGGVTDSAVVTPVNITVVDSDGEGAETIVIASSQPIGNIDLSGLDAGTTTLTLIIGSGLTTTGDEVGNPDQDFSIDGISDTTTTQIETADNVGDPAIANEGQHFTKANNSGIGNITFGATDFTGLVVTAHIVTDGTGAVGTVTSSDVDVDLTDDGDGAADSLFSAGEMGAFVWAGEVLPDANGITFTISNDAGTGLASMTLGSITAAGAGDFTLNTEGIAGVFTVTGATTVGAAAGGVAIDADFAGVTDDGISGAVTFGALAIGGDGTGAFSLDGGDIGFSSTLTIAAITLSGAGGGDILISTSTDGDFSGLVTTGAITNSGTNASNLTIQPSGTGDMNGFTASGLISNTAAAVNGALVVGATGGDLGNLTLAGIALSSTSDAGDVTFQGESIGNISSSAGLSTEQGATADIIINAAGDTTTGSIGNFTVTAGGVQAKDAGADITITANDGIGNVAITGDVGGDNLNGDDGDVTITANNGGTANTGNIGTFTVNSAIGSGQGTIIISAVDIGAITADNIGTGAAGSVTFTADGLDTTDGAGGGLIPSITVSNNIASGKAVTFNADDGIGNVSIGQDAAQGAALTFNTNVDADDDTGALGTVTAQSLGDAVDDITVTINTNAAATDNTTERGVGEITVTDGNARLSITAAGDVGAITVSGGNGSLGNDLDLVLLNLDAAGDGTNTDVPDFAGFTLTDTVNNDNLDLSGAVTIPGTTGAYVVGGSDAGDVFDLNGNSINVYNGDDVADGFDVGYASTVDNVISITAGDFTVGGAITANSRSASPLFTLVKAGETYLVDVASNVTGRVAFDADNADGFEQVTITELAGTSASDDISITTSGSSRFDVGGITPATDGLNARNILIEGELQGNLGTDALSFGDVNTIVIGLDNGNTFFGDSLKGLASQDGTLGIAGVVDVRALDTAADGTGDIVVAAGSIFRFADATGAATDVFNHSVAVTAGNAGATATIRGIDGAGDSSTDAAFLFSGSGDSTAQAGGTNDIDPNDLISDSALIARIMITGVGGLSTDASVREVDGTTNGSFLEFETSVGLVNITTQVDSISVGVEDGANLTDDAVVTGVTNTGSTSDDFDRLGGGESSGQKRGLEPATTISDANAALGNFVVQSMGDPGAANINIVVTGSAGPITLTGDTALATPDHGNLDADGGVGAAAIAIGGNAEGAITIPGSVDNDILIGIGLDLNGDGDVVDGLSELPGGSLNGNITLGDAAGVDIEVYDTINADIIVTGADQDPEEDGLELDGGLQGVKSGGTFGVLGVNVVVVADSLGAVISDAGLNSGIFSGGDGESTTIEGVGINGPGVLGGSGGIANVTFIDHAVFGDEPDSDNVDTDEVMTVQWAAAGIGATDTLGDVYLFDAADSLTVDTDNGDALNVGNVFALDPGFNSLVTPANVGRLVVADDVTIPTSEALQDLITTTYDVVRTPTSLDTASGDDDEDLSFVASILSAENSGGVIAEGDIFVDNFTADGAFGDIVSLNGEIVDGGVEEVKAGTSIGHIVSSNGLVADFTSEGTIAVGDATALHADLATFGLEGVPSWFTGGVLVEAGNIDNTNFFAIGPLVEEVSGIQVFGDAMGPIRVLAGDIFSNTSVNVAGNWTGLIVTGGFATLAIDVSGSIDMLIAPSSTLTGNFPSASLQATSGEEIATSANPFVDGARSVVPGAGVLAIVGAGATPDIDVIGLDGAGTTVTINSDVDDLTIQSAWVGAVIVNAVPSDDTMGTVHDLNATSPVTGTATLTAYNFNHTFGDFSAQTTTGTLSSTNRVDTLTNLNGDTQSLFLQGNKKVTANWTSVFGKVTNIDVYGSGNARLASVVGSKTESELKKIARRPTDELLPGGTQSAHVGEVTLNSDRLNLKGATFEGNLYSIKGAQKLNNLFVAKDAELVSANKISRGFIGGNLGTLAAASVTKLNVLGETDVLNVSSKLTNSNFFGTYNGPDPLDDASSTLAQAKIRNTLINFV
jgi:hypothetical protein